MLDAAATLAMPVAACGLVEHAPRGVPGEPRAAPRSTSTRSATDRIIGIMSTPPGGRARCGSARPANCFFSGGGHGSSRPSGSGSSGTQEGLARVGNGWHVAEFAIALAAGIAAGSVALVLSPARRTSGASRWGVRS
jgi:hypothetical protein